MDFSQKIFREIVRSCVILALVTLFCGVVGISSYLFVIYLWL